MDLDKSKLSQSYIHNANSQFSAKLSMSNIKHNMLSIRLDVASSKILLGFCMVLIYYCHTMVWHHGLARNWTLHHILVGSRMPQGHREIDILQQYNIPNITDSKYFIHIFSVVYHNNVKLFIHTFFISAVAEIIFIMFVLQNSFVH